MIQHSLHFGMPNPQQQQHNDREQRQRNHHGRGTPPRVRDEHGVQRHRSEGVRHAPLKSRERHRAATLLQAVEDQVVLVEAHEQAGHSNQCQFHQPEVAEGETLRTG